MNLTLENDPILHKVIFNTSNQNEKHVAQIVTSVGVKANNPYSITFLTWTPIFKQYGAPRTEIKKSPRL